MSRSRFAYLFVFFLSLHLHQGKSHGGVIGGILGNIGGFKPVKSLTHKVPALYVIGDSFTDSGNNNFLNTTSKANYLPYGMDFGGKPTGRFTNGKTTPDYIAERLGLPLPPPYLGLSKSKKKTTMTGVNYASGSCGIIPATGVGSGTCLNFDQQIDLLENTIKDLKVQFKCSEDFDRYLSKSLFYVDLGTNDLIDYQFFRNFKLRQQYNTPQAFGEFLSQELYKRLQRLHELGARKFVVNNVAPLGDLYSTKLYAQSMHQTPKEAADSFNNLVSCYNTKVSAVLTQLQATLPGIKMVRGDVYKFFKDLQGDPTRFGFTESVNACCIGIDRGLCLKNTATCKDVAQYVFFDWIHRTEATNLLFASRCFKNKSICSPINLKKLIRA